MKNHRESGGFFFGMISFNYLVATGTSILNTANLEFNRDQANEDSLILFIQEIKFDET